LLSVSTISGVLDVARKADVALFGIGSVLESGSTYLTLTDTIDRAELRRSDAAGELLAHLVNADGQLAGHPSNERLVAIGLDDLARIPRRIAVASGPTKAAPIAAVLRSGCVGTLVTDGRTAKEVIRKMRGTDDADAA
jgi:DNA-binding transcriptional regulator LsrR (DeoR family)